MYSKEIKDICIVGSGASGLACGRVLLEYGLEPVIFEQQNFIGGQWHFQSTEQNNENRLASAMYRDLITNLPCSVMQFSDFPFRNQNENSFIKVNEMEAYLLQYAKHHELQKYLIINAEIININEIDDVFHVSCSLKKNSCCELPHELAINLGSKVDINKRTVISETEDHIIFTQCFDAVCVCNGHYSKPYFPEIIGFDDVPESKKCHSMTYRYPEKYKDKIVVVIGGSHSGIDISGELSNWCKKVLLSMKKQDDFDPIVARLRQSMKDTCLNYLGKTFFIKPSIERIIHGTIVLFDDGTTVVPDFIIAATGYDYDFKFLSSEKLKLQYDKRRFLYPLYMQLFNVNYPQGLFSYLTIPFKVVPFPLSELQAHAVARCLKNEIKLPTTTKMLEEIDQALLTIRAVDRKYHQANMVEYVQQLFKFMQNGNDNKARNYKFCIDNDRRVRKLNTTTNACITE